MQLFTHALRKRQARRRKLQQCRGQLLSSGMSRRPQLESLEGRRLLATLTVSNLDDSGAGSLRQAITDAAAGDKIEFATDLIGTIDLASQLPTIDKALSIDGANRITLDAKGNSRIFNVNDANAGNEIVVSLSGLNLTGGNATDTTVLYGNYGGAIASHENLTVTGSTITGNTATGSGGGIRSTGTLTVTDSTLSKNTAANFGGGIHNGTEGTLTINGSTISGNTANGSNDGGDGGGGISHRGSTLTVANSTISGNSTFGGGGGIYGQAMTITNSTLKGNTAGQYGGGISGNATISLSNTIVAGNTGFADLGGFGTFSGTHNLIQDGSGGTGLTGTLTGDPMLGPLADNDGPTMTHALVEESPAIDAGSNDSLPVSTEFDQRGSGFDRIVNDTVDIGAYEVQPAAETPSLVVTIVDDTVDNTDNETSLREAIAFANSNADASTITFASGRGQAFEKGGTIRLTMGELEITQVLTIDGPDAANQRVVITGDKDDDDTTIDGSEITELSKTDADNLDDNSRIFHVTSDTSPLTLDSLTLTGGVHASQDGGAILSQGDVIVTNSMISGNHSGLGGPGSGGGGIRANIVTINGSTFSGNDTSGSGAAFRSVDATVSGSSFSGNRSDRDGGAIDVSGDIKVINSTISGNISDNSYEGGGIYASTATVIHSTITGNSSGTGGGIYSVDGGTLINSIISGNTASNGAEVSGGFTTAGINLFGHDALTTAAAFDRGFALGTNDINANSDGNNTALTDILDTTLSFNSGSTLTHALVAGSPAIDAGDTTRATDDGTSDGTSLTTDQRGTGFDRIKNDTVDIGAFEADVQTETPSLIVTTTNDVVNDTDGLTSLREAIGLANSRTGGDSVDEITFIDGLTGTIQLTLGEMLISDAVTITGPGAKVLTIDAQGNSRIFKIDGDELGTISVGISGLTLTGGNATDGNDDEITEADHGGAILSKGSLTLTELTLSGNTAAGNGGALSSQQSATVTRSTLSGNSAGNDGGGVNVAYGATFINSTLSGNNAESRGGGIAGDQNSNLTISNSTLVGNSAGDGGGGIYGATGGFSSHRMQNSIVSGNSGGDLELGFLGSSNWIQDGNNVGSGNFSGDPMLGPLADNGGPTMTHALLAGSPAINAGDNTIATVDGKPESTALTTDQRGSEFDRIKNGIGRYWRC